MDREQQQGAQVLGQLLAGRVTTRSLRRSLRWTETEEAMAEARRAGAVPLRDIEVRRMQKEIAQLTQANAALPESVRLLAARRRS